MKDDIASVIDHTNLRADATEKDIIQLCNEAIKYSFFSVCVHPSFLGIAVEKLSGREPRVSTVIGFPLGLTMTQVKLYEAVEAVLNGAVELDMVINPGWARSDEWGAVEKEIADVVAATPGVIHKVIIETCYLSDSQKKRAAQAVINSGGEFVKTSTGFAPAGAVVDDVALLRTVTKDTVGIKAAGGIQHVTDVRAFLNAGATRIGTSSGVQIMKEMEDEKSNIKMQN
jgi:deoxyribose-phosphate aldolase